MDFFPSILLSEPFNFIIGPQKRLFTIHGAAVSRLSKSLNDLLTGDMGEANDHCVYWEDVDEKTFLRFAQWAYTRDYISADPEFVVAAPQLANSKQDSAANPSVDGTVYSLASFKIIDENHTKDTCEYCGGISRSNMSIQCSSCLRSFSTLYCSSCSRYQQYKCLQCRNVPEKGSLEKGSKKQSMIQTFNNSKEYISPTISYTPRKNRKSCEEYSEVFLSHARLYTLADKYDILELRELSLHKIYVSLKEFTLYLSRVGDVVKLTSYSFENTVTGDKLRTLLVDYCACIIEDILENEGFKELVDNSSDFAFALIKKMKSRLD